MKSRLGELEASYGARGGVTYRIELWHDGLKKHRVIKGAEDEIVLRKAQMQVDDWESKWHQVSTREAERRSKDGQKKLASDLSIEAERDLECLRNILHHTLSINDAIDWNTLIDHSEFPERRPQKPQIPKGRNRQKCRRSLNRRT